MSCCDGLGPGLRVALAQQRLDELIEQARLALGGDPPAAQVASVDAGVEEALGVAWRSSRASSLYIGRPGLRFGGQHAVRRELGRVGRA